MQNVRPVMKQGMQREPRSGLPRALDAAVAIAALIITFPILLACAVAVALSSSGSILFRQTRVGRRGRPFTLYKFRTMRASATGLDITAHGDPRITRIGKLLRKTKLDELPSFWNVLKGDMALVGPRPEIPRYVNLDDSRWRAVLLARPGLTDPVTARLRSEERLLAKVGGDTERFYQERLVPFKLNGYTKYLAQRTPRTDLAVLRDTFVAVLGAGTGIVLLYKKRRYIVADLGLMALAFSLAYLLRFEFSIPQSEISGFWTQLPFVVLLQFASLSVSGVYQFIWRYTSISDVKSICIAGFASFSTLLAMRLALTDEFRYWRVPLSVLIINAAFAFTALTAARIIRRLIYESADRRNASRNEMPGGRKRVLLVGAGRCGQAILREIRSNFATDVHIEGFVDDDPQKIHAIIQGVRVVGTTEELPLLIHELAINTVVLTMTNPRHPQSLRILEICENIPVKLKVISSFWESVQDYEDLSGLRDLELAEGAAGSARHA